MPLSSRMCGHFWRMLKTFSPADTRRSVPCLLSNRLTYGTYCGSMLNFSAASLARVLQFMSGVTRTVL